MKKTNLRGRRVGVIGAGKSGLAAARLLQKKGARVLLSDSREVPPQAPKGVDTESGGHSNRLLDCRLLVRSPGVPNHLPILKKARLKRIPIWGEMELASRFSASNRIVAITGTNGKTTTTTLVGEIFKAARLSTLVGGNIGTPLSDLLPNVRAKTNLILETSSYQLEDIQDFHPWISAILNITPDHLEHHGSMKAYADAKARIFMNQTSRDTCVLNADDPICRKLAKRCKAKVVWFSRSKNLPAGIFPMKTRLPGPHNVENMLAAAAMALAAGIPLSTIKRVLETFPGVEHRLEFVRALNGVDYINDSKGTNVDSTRVALASFDKPILLIAGGQGKGSPYAPLRELVLKRVKRLLLIGEDAPRIRQELGDLVHCDDCITMLEAVRQARAIAEPGDVVLLSPACASFDQYQNYEHRGRDFKECVQKLP